MTKSPGFALKPLDPENPDHLESVCQSVEDFARMIARGEVDPEEVEDCLPSFGLDVVYVVGWLRTLRAGRE